MRQNPPHSAGQSGRASGRRAEPSSRALPGTAVQAISGVGIGVAIGVGLLVATSFYGVDLVETGSVGSLAVPQDASASPMPAPAGEVKPSRSPVQPAAQAAKPPLVAKEPPATATAPAAEMAGARTAADLQPKPLVLPAPASASDDPSDQVIEVAIAETEAAVAQLEITTGMVEPPAEKPTEIARLQSAGDRSAAAGIAPGEAAEATAQPEIPLPKLGSARVSHYVNLRAGPADEAAVVVVVPTGAQVEAEANCEWCVVTYNGQRGYIYKSFLRRSLTQTPGLY
jgi:hypothetical protein